MIYKIIKNVSEYLLVLLLILSTETVFSREYGRTNYFPYLVIFFLIFVSFLNLGKIRISRRTILYVIIYFSALIPVFFRTLQFNPGGVRKLFLDAVLLFPLSIVCTTFVIRRGEIRELIRKFQNLICWLCALSLFFWVFGSILKIIPVNTFRVIEWGNIRTIGGYYNIYFETQGIDVFGLGNYWRNTFVFTEGPMYSLVLCIALIYELLLSEKTNWLRVILITITMFSVFSTTGFLVLFCAYFAKLLFTDSRSPLRRVAILSSMIVSLPLLVSQLIKLILEKSQTGSATWRYDDFFTGLKTWLQHPFLGSGFGNDLAIVRNMTMSFRKNMGYSNGIFQILVYGGIILFLIYLLPLIKGLFSKYINLQYKTAIMLWFIILFATIMGTTPIFLFICGLTYTVMCKANLERKESD